MKRQTVSADNQEELATNQTTSVVVAGTVTANQGTAGASAWPVSAASLPLPALASTSTKQDIGNTSLASIDGKLTNPLPVSATSLPLPTNAAIETGGNLASIKTDADAISTVSGTTAGAAVITDAAGTIQQYLRGLVKLAITAGSFLVTATIAAGTAIIGTVYDEPDDTWEQTHVPAANTKATIAQASAGGALKNVCTGFTVTLCAGATAPTATQISVALIDGTTGGSTYLWRSNISIPAVAGAIVSFVVTGKKFTGSAATAMTLEFSAAAGANTFESVTMKGYTK